MERYEKNREFLKANFQVLDEIKTDAQKKLPKAPLQKVYEENSRLIELPEVSKDILLKSNVFECIEDRRSIRKYSGESIKLEELSFLLWSTQGVQKIIGDNTATLRTVPSGGASHTFETYLIVNNVEGLNKGIYRYVPLEHKLLYMY